MDKGRRYHNGSSRSAKEVQGLQAYLFAQRGKDNQENTCHNIAVHYRKAVFCQSTRRALEIRISWKTLRVVLITHRDSWSSLNENLDPLETSQRLLGIIALIKY